MKKWLSRIGICALAAGILFALSLWRDRQDLEQKLIRLHVVAQSDSPRDQAVKLEVRDAILNAIGSAMDSAVDRDQALAYLEQNLPRLKKVADQTLKALGAEQQAEITLCKEPFDARVYDSFTLPAGIYESLRITIGEGKGHNWWCVAFPSLCLPAVGEDVATVAADAGLSRSLSGAIRGEEPYALRFYLLDLLGRWETSH